MCLLLAGRRPRLLLEMHDGPADDHRLYSCPRALPLPSPGLHGGILERGGQGSLLDITSGWRSYQADGLLWLAWVPEGSLARLDVSCNGAARYCSAPLGCDKAPRRAQEVPQLVGPVLGQSQENDGIIYVMI